MGSKRKYKTPEEREAAKKIQARKYRKLRKSGKWVRKNRVLSPRILANIERDKEIAAKMEEERKIALAAEAIRKKERAEARAIRQQEFVLRSRYKKWFRELSLYTSEEREDQIYRKAYSRFKAHINTAEGFCERIVGHLAGELNMDVEAVETMIAAADAKEFLHKGRGNRKFSRALVLDAVNAVKFLLDRDNAVISFRHQGRKNKGGDNLIEPLE